MTQPSCSDHLHLAQLAHLGVRAVSCVRQLEQAMTAVVGYAQLARAEQSQHATRSPTLTQLLHAGRHVTDLLEEFRTHLGDAGITDGPRPASRCFTPLRSAMEEAAREVTGALGTDAGIVCRPAGAELWVGSPPAPLLRAITGVLIHAADVIGGRGRITMRTRHAGVSAPACLEFVAVPLHHPAANEHMTARIRPPTWLGGTVEACRARIVTWQEGAHGLQGILAFPRGATPAA